MRYQVSLLKDHERPGPLRLIEFCQRTLPNQLHDGEFVYGTFLSLFGLASNELYVVTCGSDTSKAQLPGGMSLSESHTCLPTVRPEEHKAQETPGIYVFRWFNVYPGDVDEIVQLSNAAWPEFENSFETRVQGLFVEEDETPEQMLLITWYKDLSVWEASRHPPEVSRDNFLRRHQLTRQARPIATMLSVHDQKKGLVSHS